MDSRIKLRKQEFKKTFENPRRQREEAQVQIRKQNREARFAKKRQQAFDDLDSSGSRASVPVIRSAADLLPFVEALNSNDPKAQFDACLAFRKILSTECNPPIAEVIQSGVVPLFIQFLQNDMSPELQFEAAWALTNIASGTQEQTRTLVELGATPLFIKLLGSYKDQVREQAVWALGNIAGDGPEFRDLVLSLGGLEPLLAQIRFAVEHPAKISLLRNATWALSNLARGKPRPDIQLLAPAIPIIKDLILSNDSEVITDATWALSYISDGNDDDSGTAIDIVINSGVCPRIVQLLSHTSFAVITPALRTIGNIVSGTEAQTQVVVACGCIPALRRLLGNTKKLIRKEACWSISNITAGTREQIQEVIRENIIPVMMELIRTADFEVKREANWALANAASGGSPEQIHYLVKFHVLDSLSEALGFSDQKLVGVTLEAIEAILKAGELLKGRTGEPINPYICLLEEAGAFSKLEQFQYAPEDSKIYKLAMQIMTTYLTYDEEENNLGSFAPNETPSGSDASMPQFDFGNNANATDSNASMH